MTTTDHAASDDELVTEDDGSAGDDSWGEATVANGWAEVTVSPAVQRPTLTRAKTAPSSPKGGSWFRNQPQKIKVGRRHSIFNSPEQGVADGRVFWNPTREAARADRRQSVSRPKSHPTPQKRRRPPPGFLAIPSPYSDIPARKFPQGPVGVPYRSSTFQHSPMFKDFMVGTRVTEGASASIDKLKGSPESRKYYRAGPRRGSIPCPLKTEGKKAYGQGRFQRAIKMYTEHLTEHPDDLGAVFARSKAFSAARNYPSALRDVKRLLKESPKSFQGHLQLGAVLRDQRQLLGALKAYQGALKLLPPGLKGLQWKESIGRIVDKVHNSFYAGRISSSLPFREELLTTETMSNIQQMNSILHPTPVMMPVVDPTNRENQ